MKTGDIYYRAGVDETGKTYVDEWISRTIRQPYGYLVIKLKAVTWGKRSTKNGDFGWLDPIDPLFRTRFKVVEGVPAGYARTKSAAFRKALAEARASRKKWPDDPEIVAEADAEIAALTKRLKRESSAAP